MIKQITSLISRILFIASFVVAGIAVWEKLANMMGLTLTRGYYSNWQLLEFSVVALLFVIALQLREIKISIEAKGS
jgi:uncharacterized membrane protein